MICYIPTKGRPNTTTYKLFEQAGIKCHHFIEPQDIPKYNVPNMVSIEKNNQGVGYVRNYMLQHAKAAGHEVIIMCDDDINQFGIVKGGKCVKTDAGVFHEIVSVFKKLPLEVAGLGMRQFAWAEKKPFSVNTSVFTMVTLIKPKLITWEYEQMFKEDIQFLFDAIKYGNGVIKFNRYFFNAPVVGSKKGGCYDGYKNMEHELCIPYILKKYAGFVTVVQKKIGKDIRWDFRRWAEKHNKEIR